MTAREAPHRETDGWPPPLACVVVDAFRRFDCLGLFAALAPGLFAVFAMLDQASVSITSLPLDPLSG